MAVYHVTIKVASKNAQQGMRASAHYAYLGRDGAYQKLRTDEETVHVKSGNMPSWARYDASIFWLASDKYERKNGSVYRELEAALPRELSSQQQQEIVQEFIDEVLGTQHPYSLSIHVKVASDGLPQPHVHLMWSERQMDDIERDPSRFFSRAVAARKGKDGQVRNRPNPADGGCKKISMQPRLLEFRALWADLTNKAYLKAGFQLSVSHLSLKAQGASREPERHLGPFMFPSDESNILVARRRAHIDAQRAEAEGLRVMAEFKDIRVSQSRIRKLAVTNTLGIKKIRGRN
jgi:hypothetical protein